MKTQKLLSRIDQCIRVALSASTLLCYSAMHAATYADDKEFASGYKTVIFGNQRLRIPNPYLVGQSVDGRRSALWFGMLLPDLSPASSNPSEFQRVGWHRQITALFEYGRQARDPDVVANEMLSEGNIDPRKFDLSNGNCRRYHGNMATATEIYICGPAPTRLFVTCGLGYSAPRPSCNVMENIGQDVMVSYNYSQDYASRAIEIDALVRNFYHKIQAAQ